MKLFDCANAYCKESNWKTLALIKFCLFSIGIIVGTFIPKDYLKLVLTIFIPIFLITYIPLIIKFFKIWKMVNSDKN